MAKLIQCQEKLKYIKPIEIFELLKKNLYKDFNALISMTWLNHNFNDEFFKYQKKL
jgi:hypothetical protein